MGSKSNSSPTFPSSSRRDELPRSSKGLSDESKEVEGREEVSSSNSTIESSPASDSPSWWELALLPKEIKVTILNLLPSFLEFGVFHNDFVTGLVPESLEGFNLVARYAISKTEYGIMRFGIGKCCIEKLQNKKETTTPGYISKVGSKNDYSLRHTDRLLCSAEGLVCVDRKSQATILNPTNHSEIKIVPNPTKKEILGFGCTINEGFKLIAVDNVSKEQFFPYQLYRSKRASWTKILKGPGDYLYAIQPGKYLNGYIYFLAQKPQWKDKISSVLLVLLQFNFQSETFDFHHLPESIVQMKVGDVHIEPIYNRLAISCKNDESTNVWLANDEGRWCNTFKFPHFRSVISSLLFVLSYDEVLVKSDDSFRLVNTTTEAVHAVLPRLRAEDSTICFKSRVSPHEMGKKGKHARKLARNVSQQLRTNLSTMNAYSWKNVDSSEKERSKKGGRILKPTQPYRDTYSNSKTKQLVHPDCKHTYQEKLRVQDEHCNTSEAQPLTDYVKGLGMGPCSSFRTPASSADDMTMMESLIGLVNRIQRACTVLGDYGDNLFSSLWGALPTVAVISGQSSGESLVLEGIVGRDFVPRGSGIVTRQPLVLRLHNTNDGTQEYAEFLHIPRRKFSDFALVRKEIQEKSDRITGKTKMISCVPINLSIYSPKVANLTLIDLPGLTKAAVEGQPESIENMVRTYVEKVIEGRSYCLQHPWVGIVNHSQADINENVDLIDARHKEREYLATSPEYGPLASKMGSEYLGELLSKRLESVIRSRIPSITSLIDKSIEELESEMDHLGRPIAVDAGAKQPAQLLDEDRALMEKRQQCAKRLELYKSARDEIDSLSWAR